MDERLQALERRVARSERLQNRLLTLLLGSVLVVGITLAAPGATQHQGTTVRAPFRVVDAAGRTLLDVSLSGTRAVVTVADQKGKPAASLVDNGAGGTLVLYEDGRAAGGLSTDAKEGTALLLFQVGNPHPLVKLEAAPTGGRLTLKNDQGKTTHRKP